jgi:Flp pilus assembly protein CpaB
VQDVTGVTSSARGPVRPPGVRGRIRLSSGHVAMIVAGLVGAVASLAALPSDGDGRAVLVAAQEIGAGERFDPSAARAERINAPARLLHAFVLAREANGLRNRVVVAPIHPGEPVVRSALRRHAAPHGLRAMSIPVEPSHAVAGRLAVGDRIDVLVAGSGDVSMVVADAEVLAVDERARGGIGESSSPFTVTIAVDVEASRDVAAAIADGGISIARTTGAQRADRDLSVPTPEEEAR